jgi:hypothetical protein
VENLNRAVIFDRRELSPPVVEDEKDRKIKELEKNVRALENQIAHLKWVIGANSFL